jgi:hypothetical protein
MKNPHLENRKMTELHVGGASILRPGRHSPVHQDATEPRKKAERPSSSVLTKALNQRYNEITNWAMNPKKLFFLHCLRMKAKKEGTL